LSRSSIDLNRIGQTTVRQGKRIAFLGGAFDPPHIGHAMLAKRVLALGLSDLVLWVPSWAPPHKNSGGMTEFFHRCNMVKIVLEQLSGSQLSDIEERKKFDPSYSFKIMSALEEEFPDCRIQLLIGQDSLEQLHTWYCARELVEKFEVIAFPRKDSAAAEDNAGAIPRLPLDFWGDKLTEKLKNSLVAGDYVEISSTYLREALANNRSLHNIIDAGVLEYIKKNGLYRRK